LHTAVSVGYVPSDLQIGLTGKIITPRAALDHRHFQCDPAPHWHQGRIIIVASSKKVEMPISKVGDLGLVGDLFRLLPELEASLQVF
jgi:electron transfer flavoprotein alpha subunit